MKAPIAEHPPTPPPLAARFVSVFRRFHASLAAWCAGRNGYWRLPILAWLIYIGVGHLFNPEYVSWFYFLNAPIHEAGHFITGIFGFLPLTVAAGTLFQLGAPVAAAINFRRQDDQFALSVCGVWLATNLYYVAWYMADARSMSQPMARPFGLEPDIHDWNYMLGGVGLLAWDTTISRWVVVLAGVVMWLSIAAAAYMIVLMIWPQQKIDNRIVR